MTIQLVAIQFVVFVFIILILHVFFNRQLSMAMKRLQELNRQNLEKEVSLNKELERAKQERQLEIEKGREEAKRLREAVKQEVEKSREQMLSGVHQDAKRVLEEATQECERMKRDANRQIDEAAINVALSIIREIFSQNLRQELQRQLVDELIEALGKIGKDKFASAGYRITVISSYPLIDSQKETIKNIISQASSRPVELEEKIDPSILSGIIIDLGGVILDGSIKNKLNKILPKIRSTQNIPS